MDTTKSLQETSIKYVFSALEEKFTSHELETLQQNLDQLLESSQTLEQLISRAQETLNNKRLVATA